MGCVPVLTLKQSIQPVPVHTSAPTQLAATVHPVESDLAASHIPVPLSSSINLTYCLSEFHPDSTGPGSPRCSSSTFLEPSHALATSDKSDCSSASLLLGSVDEDIRNSCCCSCDHQSQHSRCEHHREEYLRDLSTRGCLLHSSRSAPVGGSSPATSPSIDCERYPPSGIHLQSEQQLSNEGSQFTGVPTGPSISATRSRAKHHAQVPSKSSRPNLTRSATRSPRRRITSVIEPHFTRSRSLNLSDSMHPTGIFPVRNIHVHDVTDVIPPGIILPIPAAQAHTRRGSFIDGCSPLTLIIDLPISKFPSFIGQQSSRPFIPKPSISRNRSLYINFMSLAISRPNDEVAWLKFLAFPLLLFTPSQQLTTRQVMDKLALDDWQSFFLSHTRPSHPSHTDHPLPSNASLQLRCAKLVESGNLGKAFQLISSPSSVTSLTPAETIALLQAQHPLLQY